MTWDDAETELVRAQRFVASSTRPMIWDGLERYLARFGELEDANQSVLDGLKLVRAIWLGGSFVSSEQEPRNIDVTVFGDDAAFVAMGGRPGAGWLSKAFYRDHTKALYHLDPLLVRYRPISSTFQSHKLSPADTAYLRERGAWDEWWQRMRGPGASGAAPSRATIGAVRGYVEVVLDA